MQKTWTEQLSERILGDGIKDIQESKSRQPLFFLSVPKQDFYSPRQVANVLLFSDQTLWRWLRDGRIPTVKCGRYYRISFDTLSELVRDGSSLIRQNLINKATFAASKFSK